MIFDWAERTPGKTAVVHNGERWSYRAFAGRIAQAQAWFASRGYAGPGYAAIAVRNLLEFWVLSLALRSLGLSTTVVPSADAVRTLGLPNLRCVVTRPEEDWPALQGVCAELGLDLLSVSLDGEPAAGPGVPTRQHAPGGHILYTSGTTGDYKKVLMTPAIDDVLLRRQVDIVGLDQNSMFATFHFPAWTSVGYRWGASPWIVGGATVLEQRGEPHRALLQAGLTHALLTPDMLATVLAAPEDAYGRNDAIQLLVGGAPMTLAQAAQARSRITSRLYSWLASTEAAGIALTALDTPDDHRWHRIAPGRVVEIVDDMDRPTPRGVVGRLRAHSSGGITGYLCDDEATKTYFKDGYFYTGDLGLMRSDGRLALEGRVTHVLNINGQKFSPAPIEDDLCDKLGVSGVFLFSKQNDLGEEVIHVVLESPTAIDTARLTAVLRRKFGGAPPILVHFVPVLPRSPMGKLVRQEAKAQVLARAAPA